MYPQAVCVALLAHIGVVAVGHVPVFRKPVDPVHVLVPCVHQGKAVVARCSNQAVGVTLKHSGTRVTPRKKRRRLGSKRRRRLYQLLIGLVSQA